MSRSERPSLSMTVGNRCAAYVVLVSAWLVGSVSLVAFFMLFLWLGSLNLVDLALSERAALGWDALLCCAFFLQHSCMVRKSYQKWSSTFLSSCYHGAVYTIASGVFLLVLVVFWQESAQTLLAAEGIHRWSLRVIYLFSVAGFIWGMLALGSFDTFGLRPILDRLRGTESPPLPFTVRGPYRWVRHPLYTFCLLMIWSCPDLTVDRLLFNVLFTIWIVIGTVLEERDLTAAFGETYVSYQRKVPMLFPRYLRPPQ